MRQPGHRRTKARSSLHIQRADDRRRTWLSVRFPDRRRGFERRAARGPARRAYLQMLAGYQERPGAVASVLAVFVVLNLADLALTLFSLDRGAVEANPVMALLLGIHPSLAAALKISITLLVAAALWWLRRYRRALEASLLVLAGLLALFVYQVAVAIRVSV